MAKLTMTEINALADVIAEQVNVNRKKKVNEAIASNSDLVIIKQKLEELYKRDQELKNEREVLKKKVEELNKTLSLPFNVEISVSHYNHNEELNVSYYDIPSYKIKDKLVLSNINNKIDIDEVINEMVNKFV